MMKYITYKRDLKISQPNGRSGHAVKDLFTSVILGVICDLDVVYLRSEWEGQQIFSNLSYRELPTEGRQLTYDGQSSWGGISLERFLEVRNEVEAAPSDVTVILTNVFRIHLSQVHQWEADGHLAPQTFSRCLAALRKLYWRDDVVIRRGEVAIHARRGDVANPRSNEYAHMGPGVWHAGFYHQMIEQIRRNFQPQWITIYSEKLRAHDLLELPHACLELGEDSHVSDHLHKMVTAEFFVPSCSSLSTWAAYLSVGTVLIPKDKEIKHFAHPELLSNWKYL